MGGGGSSQLGGGIYFLGGGGSGPPLRMAALKGELKNLMKRKIRCAYMHEHHFNTYQTYSVVSNSYGLRTYGRYTLWSKLTGNRRNMFIIISIFWLIQLPKQHSQMGPSQAHPGPIWGPTLPNWGPTGAHMECCLGLGPTQYF